MITCESVYGHPVSVPEERLVFRPSVYAVIPSGDRLLLVTSRSARKYCFPGGGIELGERMEEALRREVREEAGIEVEIGRLLHFKEHFFYYDPSDEAFHGLMAFYLCRPRTIQLAGAAQVGDEDAERSGWIGMERLTQENFLPAQWEVLARLRDVGASNF